LRRRFSKKFDRIWVAVCHPRSNVALADAVEAADDGLIEPILVGPKSDIQPDAEKSRERHDGSIADERRSAMVTLKDLLEGKRGLVVGIANAHSVAYGCARAFHAAGAELAVTYLNAKAEPYVRPLAETMACPLILPCDVREAGQLEAVFAAIGERWGKLDFLLHSIAWAPKADLNARVADCSRDGFLAAMDISCHSFIRMTHLAEPLMTDGGALMTVSFYGSEKVVEHYNLMGPVKAALESTVRYLAAELGAKGIRVHSLSPGPLKTRAASGIDGFDELLQRAAATAPEHQLVDIDEIGALAAFLASDAAKRMTGEVIYIDGGYHIMA
jgi:enoyl-[acyl-carrier protein] reductase I